MISELTMARIYLSSTYGDLATYRESVYKVLRQLRHDVIAMEDYVATDSRPLDKCLADVAGCDVYIGVFAWRYGYVPDKDNPERKSITELEYRQACEKNIPRLIFLLDEKVTWPRGSKDAETGENEGGRLIAELRRELSEERLISFFKTEDQLAGQVSVAINNLNSQRFESAIPNPAAQRRNSGAAPPIPEYIVGRDADLAELKRRLGVGAHLKPSGQAHAVTAVRGWPGVGKTTLATALAHQPDVNAAFPDGILWTSLGQSPSILHKLCAWGAALGVSDLRFAPSVEEASARLRAILRDKRVLIIVDDVWDAGDFEPFRVGGALCSLLITTRLQSVARRVPEENIYPLGLLSKEDALNLLKIWAPSIVAESPTDAVELVETLEFLPLSICVAGKLLSAEAAYGFSVRQLLKEIREGLKLLESKAPEDIYDYDLQSVPTVRVLLKRSTDRLRPETRDRYAYLGAFAPKPASFDINALKAVWEVDDPTTTVRQLIDHGLLEPIPQTGRYQMHALLVKHAQSLCDTEE
jgi:hypothetical protein